MERVALAIYCSLTCKEYLQDGNEYSSCDSTAQRPHAHREPHTQQGHQHIPAEVVGCTTGPQYVQHPHVAILYHRGNWHKYKIINVHGMPCAHCATQWQLTHTQAKHGASNTHSVPRWQLMHKSNQMPILCHGSNWHQYNCTWNARFPFCIAMACWQLKVDTNILDARLTFYSAPQW